MNTGMIYLWANRFHVENHLYKMKIKIYFFYKQQETLR